MVVQTAAISVLATAGLLGRLSLRVVVSRWAKGSRFLASQRQQAQHGSRFALRGIGWGSAAGCPQPSALHMLSSFFERALNVHGCNLLTLLRS